jgi:hypothetical protein
MPSPCTWVCECQEPGLSDVDMLFGLVYVSEVPLVNPRFWKVDERREDGRKMGFAA